ncbi:MAG: LysE family transporter [Saprospiraceae bacterium]
MNFILIVFLGIVLSFFGGLPMGMTNMTVVNITIKNGIRAGVFVAIGAAIMEFFMTMVSFLLSNMLLLLNNIERYIHYFTLGLFLLLAVVYFSKKEDTTTSETHENDLPTGGTPWRFLMYGLFLGSINILTVPYWLVYIIYLKSHNILHDSTTDMITFSISTAIGWFLLLYMYVRGGDYLTKRVNNIGNKINLVTACVFVFLAFIEIIKISRL